MGEEEWNNTIIANDLAKATAGYMGSVVLVASGKGSDQRGELSDIEKYAANIMLMIAVNKVANYFNQDPSVIHLLALANFWEGVYSHEEIMTLQNMMIDEFNNLLANDRDVLENIANLFMELSQEHDIKLVEQLGGIFRMWIESLGA